MRVVVATSPDEPFGALFWESYFRAGGLLPSAVVLLQRRRRRPVWRQAMEGLLLFGTRGSVRAWSSARRTQALLRRAPGELFGGAAVRTLRSLNAAEGAATLRETAPDLLISVGAPEIFKPAVLRAPALAAINVHNGRLPAYRGLFGTFWEARAGEAWGYTSVHVMEPEVDAGAVLAQGAVRLAGATLMEALAAKKQLGGRLLAWLVGFVAREGRLPPPCPLNAGLAAGYYSWPSLREMVRFRLQRLTGSRASSGARHAVMAWPTEMAVGDC